MLTHAQMAARIAVGGLLGALIGYERHRHGRQAGLRTHLLVALASALFMVVSSQFAYYQGFQPGGLIEVDASRVAASVVSAVGFLGAGAILRTGATVQGVTTAAGLWLVTAIGLSAGAGMYVEAGIGTSLGLVALALLRRLESKGQRLHCKLSLNTADPQQIAELLRTLEQSGAAIAQLELRRNVRKEVRTVIEFELRRPERFELEALLRELQQLAGVQRVEVQRRS